MLLRYLVYIFLCDKELKIKCLQSWKMINNWRVEKLTLTSDETQSDKIIGREKRQTHQVPGELLLSLPNPIMMIEVHHENSQQPIILSEEFVYNCHTKLGTESHLGTNTISMQSGRQQQKAPVKGQGHGTKT